MYRQKNTTVDLAKESSPHGPWPYSLYKAALLNQGPQRHFQPQFYLTSLERLKRSVQSLGRGFGAESSEAKLDFARN